MKILCLLVALANIFLFAWEYRSGAFLSHNKSIEQPLISGKEPIILLSELKKRPPPIPTNVKQAMPLNPEKPDNITKETLQDEAVPDTSSTTPVAQPAKEALP
jgi:hypothetical protein